MVLNVLSNEKIKNILPFPLKLQKRAARVIISAEPCASSVALFN
jgi:hypothetical protein